MFPQCVPALQRHAVDHPGQAPEHWDLQVRGPWNQRVPGYVGGLPPHSRCCKTVVIGGSATIGPGDYIVYLSSATFATFSRHQICDGNQLLLFTSGRSSFLPPLVIISSNNPVCLAQHIWPAG